MSGSYDFTHFDLEKCLNPTFQKEHNQKCQLEFKDVQLNYYPVHNNIVTYQEHYQILCRNSMELNDSEQKEYYKFLKEWKIILNPEDLFLRRCIFIKRLINKVVEVSHSEDESAEHALMWIGGLLQQVIRNKDSDDFWFSQDFNFRLMADLDRDLDLSSLMANVALQNGLVMSYQYEEASFLDRDLFSDTQIKSLLKSDRLLDFKLVNFNSLHLDLDDRTYFEYLAIFNNFFDSVLVPTITQN